MKYKSSEGNVYSSDNIDPEFIEYLYSLPAEFLDEMFIAWVMVKNKKKKGIITEKEIQDLYISLGKVDLTKLGEL